MSIPGCTTGKHTTVVEKPVAKPKEEAKHDPRLASLEAALRPAVPRTPSAIPKQSAPAPPPDSESDDPSLHIEKGVECRRRGCKVIYDPAKGRDDETCVHHPGHPLFHEGSKGWTCCKRRVLEFDDFLRMEGCTTKNRHIFIGKGKKKNEEEKLDAVRYVNWT
jgi:CHORD